MHFVNCKRTPQQAKWDLSRNPQQCYFSLIHGQIAKTLYCSKSLQKQAILRNPQQNVWNLEPVCEINEQMISCVFSKLNLSRNPQLLVESTNCKRNPQLVSGIRINLRNLLTFEESAYICGIRNNYLYSLVAESATKSMCRQNLRYSYL